MTAMDTHVESIPLPASGPPAPPPPPGCAGGVQLPHWRNEPLPPHLAPTKEEIDKEQYANLPDKLLNTMNKDKKPFTYTPHGVSGVDKGKLDLSNIRSPKMRKRLMANIADDEDSEPDRVTRSETPDLLSKPQPLPNNRRAITPDVISLQKQIYAPVLPKEVLFPEGRQSPLVNRREPQPKQELISNSIPQKEFEDFLNKQMEEMEKSVTKPKQQIIYDSQAEVEGENVGRLIPIKLENTQQEVVKPNHDNEPESTKPVETVVNYQLERECLPNSPQLNGKDMNVVSNRYDSNGNKTESKLWDSDLLKHVLDGGLQEEIEKFEQISLETEDSLNRNRSPRIDDNYSRSPQSAPTWSPPKYIQDNYTRNQSPTPFGSLNRNHQSSSPKSAQSQPWNGQNYWSESPSPSPSLYQHNSPTTDPLYTGGHIPSKSFQSNKTGFADTEVPNYNSRPKPFYLCSPPPTPTATPPPQQQPKHPQKRPQTPNYGNKFPPQKISYQNEIFNNAMTTTPQTKYIDSSHMYSQTTYTEEEWTNPGIRSPDPHLNSRIRSPEPFMNSGVRTPDPYKNSGISSPEPHMNSTIRSTDPYMNSGANIKKKLPPSEQSPDRTPSKYMGANIPSRSFRVLQLITGEDIENQFSNNEQNNFLTNIRPKSTNSSANSGYNNSNTPQSSGYSSNRDFGTDF